MVCAPRRTLAAAVFAGIAVSSGVASSQEPPPEIVNGLPTSGFPTVGALVDAATGSFCTATLVGCRTVLTAAHCLCVTGNPGAACPDGASLPDPSSFFFYLQHAGFFGVRSIAVHPSFSFGVTSDLAVLQLQIPVRGVDPSSLNALASPSNGTPGTLVGFGRSAGLVPDGGVKRFGAVEIGSCAAAGVPDATHVCWTYATPIGPPGGDSTTCFGDSGGPLFADVGAGPTLGGVTSGGSSATCSPTDVAWDADVFLDHAWIESQAGIDASEVCGDGPPIGDPAVTVFAVDGDLSAGDPQDFHQTIVPAGTQLLRVALNGEDTVIGNDFDVYARFGAPPTTATFDCASFFAGSFEYCEISEPAAGTWHFLADRFSGSGDYQLTVTMLPENPAPPALDAGDVAVGDFASSEILQIDATSGDRNVAASSLRGVGENLVGPWGVAFEADGNLLATDADRFSLFRIDPATGDRSVVSGCPDAACTSTVGTGPDFEGPRFVRADANGNLLVTDERPGALGRLLRVDPVTGDRTLLSGCPDPCPTSVGTGVDLVVPFGVQVESGGSILVVDNTLRTLFRIDSATGDRTVLSGCADILCSGVAGAGPLFGAPYDVALEASGDILVSDAVSPASGLGAVVRVDSVTGDRAVLSGCLDPVCAAAVGTGPDLTAGLTGIAIDPSGELLATDLFQRAIFRIDPGSGDRSIHSGCDDATCATAAGAGTLVALPVGIDVVPLPEPDPGLALAAGLATLALLARRRAAHPSRNA